MNINLILKKQKESIKLDKEELNSLKEEVKKVSNFLEEEIAKQGANAEIFMGGSFAKGTLLKKESYDIDMFIRFDWKFDDISGLLEKIVERVNSKLNYNLSKIHGSRDYFKLQRKNVIFEIIPVYKIKKPKEARNVTDLSYFHVNYVKKKLRKNSINEEILLAKKFCQAQEVYGAESYIKGFSGYALECLIIQYKSFLKMIKALSNSKERIVLDPESHYKKKQDILFLLNENKLQGPIVLVDPTFKERNVLAALNAETFRKFQESSKRFLKSPSISFFEAKELDIDRLKNLAEKKSNEFIHLKIKTDRQSGDIAGSKMKKFANFLTNTLSKYFDIIEKEFLYSDGQESNFYLVVKAKKEIILFGPPTVMEKNAKAFKKNHKNIFEKSGKLYAKEKINFNCKEFLKRYYQEQKTKIIDMGIIDLKQV